MEQVEPLPTTGPRPAPPISFWGRGLRSRKGFLHSTHRICSPEATLARIAPLLEAARVTRIANITGLDRIGIPVTLPVRPNSRSLSTAAGKGIDLPTAMASGAMESLELHHAEWCEPEIVGVGTERWMARRCEIIPSTDLQLIRAAPPARNIPQPWVLGWDIARQTEVAVTIHAVHMAPYMLGYVPMMPWLVAAGSNGLASGNSLLEAIAAALYEAIERDAIACSAMVERPRPAPENLADAEIADLLARFRAAGVRVELRDCTIDTAVPTYQVRATDELDRRIPTVHGEGTHLDPRIALIRALTEAAQARAVIIAGSRDEILTRQLLVPYRAEHPPFRAGPPAPPRVSDAGLSFEEDVALVLRRLAAAGMHHVVVFDLSPPGGEIAVARVVVPHLEGYMFAHYTPGRRAKRAMAAG